MKNVDKLDIYNNSAIILDKKTPNKIISWITILFIFLILIIIASFIPFNIYKSYIGYFNEENNNSFYVFITEYSDFPVIKNKNLYIKGKKYNYSIIGIENNNLILEIDNSEELQINNNMAVLNILKNRTTLFKIIKNKIKKGFGLWKI